MHKITRNVRDLEREERKLYESVLGETLRENQVVILQVVNLGESGAAEGTGLSLIESDAATRERIRAAGMCWGS